MGLFSVGVELTENNMRLEGKAKLGFYPTPHKVLEDVISNIQINGNARVLDTCCGDGQPLQIFKQKFPDITTYGVELDSERAAQSKEVVDHVLNCDALGEFKATNGVFDVLFLNPPYDYDTRDDDNKSVRLERKFLEYHRKYLKVDGGILILIIPYYSLKDVRGLLARYDKLQVIPFEESEFRAFRQVVIIAQSSKKETSDMVKRNNAYLDEMVEMPDFKYRFSEENTATFSGHYETTATDLPLKTFYTSRINPDEAIELINNSKIKIIQDFQHFTTTRKLNSIQPLTELSQGHSAMLVAAGLMDGYLKADDGEELVVKGMVEESYLEREEITDESEKIIRKKTYNVVVEAINLTTNEYVRII